MSAITIPFLIIIVIKNSKYFEFRQLLISLEFVRSYDMWLLCGY